MGSNMDKKIKEWSDKSILQTIKNTCKDHYHESECKELTFYGFPNQPDFVIIKINMKANELAIELKSLKQYLLQYRNKHISYERILNCIFEDINTVYSPKYLKVELETQPRGGISSKLWKSI